MTLNEGENGRRPSDKNSVWVFSSRYSIGNVLWSEVRVHTWLKLEVGSGRKGIYIQLSANPNRLVKQNPPTRNGKWKFLYRFIFMAFFWARLTITQHRTLRTVLKKLLLRLRSIS